MAVLVLISITIITLDERVGSHHLTSGVKSVASDLFSPVRGGVNAIVRPIGDFFAGAFNYGSLQQENNKLRATIGELRQQQSESAFQHQQLQELTKLQHLAFLGSLPTTTAAVQNSNVSNFDATVQINKGRDEGVQVGNPVVGDGGLVGSVTFASKHTATVTLVTDGQSKVGIQFGPATCTSCWGTTQGQGPGKDLAVNFVQPGTKVTKHQMLYTSQSQGGVYPSGIPVAKVAASHQVSGATQITIRAQPAASLAGLSYVDVVQWEPGP